MKTKPAIVKEYLINIYGILCVVFAILVAAAKIITPLVTSILILCITLLSLANKNADRQHLIKYPPLQNTHEVNTKLRPAANTSPQVAVTLTHIPINIHLDSHVDHHVYFREHYNLINYSDEVKN